LEKFHGRKKGEGTKSQRSTQNPPGKRKERKVDGNLKKKLGVGKLTRQVPKKKQGAREKNMNVMAAKGLVIFQFSR